MNLRFFLGTIAVCALLVLLLMYGAHSEQSETNAGAPATHDRNSTSPDEQGESGSLIEPPTD